MGRFYFTLDPREMSWSAFKGYWGEKADEVKEKLESPNYHLTLNPSEMKWSAVKGYWGEKADELTERCKSKRFDTYIEFNPAKWNKDSFSVDRYSDFMTERMELNPIFRYGVNWATSNAKPITSLGMSKKSRSKICL